MNRYALTIKLLIIFGFSTNANVILADNKDSAVTQTCSDGSALMWVRDAVSAKTSSYDLEGLMTRNELNNWLSRFNSINYRD